MYDKYVLKIYPITFKQSNFINNVEQISTFLVSSGSINIDKSFKGVCLRAFHLTQTLDITHCVG